MSLVACSIKGYDAFSLRVFTVGLHLNETIELCRSNGCFTAIEEVSLWNMLDLLHVLYNMSCFMFCCIWTPVRIATLVVSNGDPKKNKE